MSANWFNNFVSGYQQVANEPNSSMPGAFPEESVEPAQRNSYNSRKIKQYLDKFSDHAQVIIFKPIIFVLFVIFTILAKLINLIYFRDRRHRRSTNSNPLNEAIDRSNKFIRNLEENLSPSQSQNHVLPPFFQGSYTQALYMATKKGKFLFVYLTNPQSERFGSIFNKIIINEKFSSLFNDPNFIIWGGDLTNPESYQLANSLNVTKFPFLGLLALTRNTTMSPEGPIRSAARISLLVKIQGDINDDINADTLIQNKFMKKIEKYEPELNLMRKELMDKFINQVFLKQQDLNYQLSLQKDKEKKLKKQHEKVQRQYLIWKLNWFKAQEEQKQEQNEEGVKKAKIAIKLPNGERVTHLFSGESTVVDIFDYIELYRGGYFDREVESVTVDESEFVGFKPQYKFKLMSPLPPKITLNDLDHTTIIKNIDCVYPNGLLIVEDI